MSQNWVHRMQFALVTHEKICQTESKAIVTCFVSIKCAIELHTFWRNWIDEFVRLTRLMRDYERKHALALESHRNRFYYSENWAIHFRLVELMRRSKQWWRRRRIKRKKHKQIQIHAVRAMRTRRTHDEGEMWIKETTIVWKQLRRSRALARHFSQPSSKYFMMWRNSKKKKKIQCNLQTSFQSSFSCLRSVIFKCTFDSCDDENKISTKKAEN